MCVMQFYNYILVVLLYCWKLKNNFQKKKKKIKNRPLQSGLPF